ncbi:hypothetical protein AN1V17_09990 [Vallitalea sediminicola]
MARISRKASNKQNLIENPKIKIYQTALYVRLSNEDNGNIGSNSIDVQKTLLMNYLAMHIDLHLYKIYTDNGMTGTNFERPAFKAMINAVRKGKVNCIIVKDLSRLGRNFVETGHYIEQIFPFMGVRFISINDSYDSADTDTDTNAGLMIALKNLVNAAYSKDLSKKVCSQKKLQQQKGNFIGTYAPYGYRKNPHNSYQLIIDEETAPIIKNIFTWRADGQSVKDITRRLNDENVPSPMRHRYLKGEVKSKRYKDILWKESTLYAMLTKQVYLGHMVQGVVKVISCGSNKIKYIPKEDWMIVKNKHEPIMTEALFNKAQVDNERYKNHVENEIGGGIHE